MLTKTIWFVERKKNILCITPNKSWHYSPNTFYNEFTKVGFKNISVRTEGLDLDHIKTTLTLVNNKEGLKKLENIYQHKKIIQDFVNQFQKGDNLRLFAQK